MGKYESIRCKECGNGYVTDSPVSTCPVCGATNYSAAGGFVMLLIALAIIVFAIAMFGAITWSIVAWRRGLKKWHHVGAILLALGGCYFFIDTSDDANEIVLLIGILCNVSAILHSGFRLKNANPPTFGMDLDDDELEHARLSQRLDEASSSENEPAEAEEVASSEAAD